jgi:hypothetical protein
MSWTGTVPPKRMKIIAEYEDGRLVRQSTSVYAKGGMMVTELRCTCVHPEAGCILHKNMNGGSGV